MDNENVTYESAVMRVIIQPLVEEELDLFDTYNSIPHTYSDKFQKKLRRIFRKDRARRILWRTGVVCRRIAVCLMVAAAITLISCAAIKPLREKIADAILTWYDEYVAVVFMKDDNTAIMKELTYIPESYVLAETYEMDETFIQFFVDPNGMKLKFSCMRHMGDAVLYDHEHFLLEEIHIGNDEGIFFIGEPGYGNMITWVSQGYEYSIAGEVTREEFVKMIESLQ